MVRRIPFQVVLLLLASLALNPASLAAQTTADILGRVSDTSGGVLPGATVTIENTATKDVRTSVSSETGDYLFTLLPIGPYTVRIELQGFQSQTAKVTLTSGDRIRVDGRLAVGSLQETVMVTGESPLLQTDQSTLSSLVSEQAVQDLPVNGRNFMRLVQLVPGATEGAANALNSGTRPDDRRGTSSVSINGAPDNMNNQMIDGMDNNERAIGTVGVKPSMDAIAEVRVQTNLYLAETGRTGGGIINILTKSGTNTFHGSAYEFRRDDMFDERDYFAVQDPVLDQNQFGGSIGGPIVSNRTFFFGDYEGLKTTKGQVNNLTLPTMKMRTGDFSELLQGPNPVQIYDPSKNPRQPFEGNIIPLDRLNPIALRYMSLLPANTNGDLANNYRATTMSTTDSHTTDGRIDHRFNTNNSFFARYSYNNLDFIQPGGCDPATTGQFAGLSAVCRGDETGGFPGNNKTTAHAVQGNYVRVFNSTLIGEFKAAYTHYDLASLPWNYKTNAADQIGIKNSNLPDEANGQGLTTLTITGYTPLGDAGNVPLISHGRTPQYAASLTKTMGAHSIKAGGGIIMRKFGVIQSQSPLGTYTFNANLTRGPNNQGGNSMASMMLGYPTQITRQHSPYKPEIHSNEPSIFIQDDWRTTSWLTLNIGLRYDVYTPFTDENNKLSNMDLTIPQPVVMVAGENGVSSSAGVKTDYSNIAPRFGFAATLPRSTVLRGGWGLTYFPANVASQYYMKNPPLFDSYGPVTSNGNNTNGLPNLFFSDGLPAFDYNSRPDVSPTALRGQFRPVAVDFKSTRVQQFNIQIEKELSGYVFTAGYIGSRSDRVAQNDNINLAPPGTTNADGRREFNPVLPNVTTINLGRSWYESTYDAVQFVAQRRFSGGLSLNSHFRLSSAENLTTTPWDIHTPEWQLAGQDIHHSFVFQANYALPFGEGMTGFKGGLVKGWQVNAVANWQGGTPVNISNSTERANTGGGDRPNQVADPVLPKDDRTVDKYFNTLAYVAQPVGTLGDAERTFMHGPAQRRLDLAIFKDVQLGGPHSLQLRYEIYNITNTANFQNPNAALGNAAYGRISSTGNAIPRQMQFAVKYLF